MTASAQAALDAMAAAEQEARRYVDRAGMRLIPTWARDRVRLADLHRDTLDRHAPTDYGDGQPNYSCEVCGVHSPCLDLQAVIGYWCHDEETA